MSQNERFLLIKAWGSGFWSDMSHIAGQLLIAELTDRIPVVYWGADSLYASEDPEVKDAFTMYFLPMSNYIVDHLVNEKSYYPIRWNGGNLRSPGIRNPTDLEHLAIAEVFRRPETVLVSNFHIYVNYLTQWIGPNHYAYGWGIEDIYSHLYQKYFNLQPYLSAEIEDFYLKNMKNNHPILGVHIRGSDKIIECQNLHELNDYIYPRAIDSYLNKNSTASIFFLTDSESILSRYKRLYGNKLIYTDCIRTPDENLPVHRLLPFYNKRQKGIDIIKDTYLATKCDYFIGNKTSNVSIAVDRLKAWPKETITLL
ncbi:O-fucosyltransferase family protein [Peribacillus butanolivorans]|uniref:O-fucosyltransferase family protein n=1 Tax=Peribacillus butanolivorans TaxID=421767 RepID=UPI0030C9284D